MRCLDRAERAIRDQPPSTPLRLIVEHGVTDRHVRIGGVVRSHFGIHGDGEGEKRALQGAVERWSKTKKRQSYEALPLPRSTARSLALTTALLTAVGRRPCVR